MFLALQQVLRKKNVQLLHNYTYFSAFECWTTRFEGVEGVFLEFYFYVHIKQYLGINAK